MSPFKRTHNQHTAINLLAERAPTLPACILMTGDFNCHSREWDPSVPHHRTTAISLLDTAARLGLELTLPVNPGPTFLSHNVELRGSVIDLVFIKASESLVQPRRLLEWQGLSDHIPLASKFSLPSELEEFKRVSIAKGSDAEMQFVEQLIGGIRGIRLETPTTIAEVDVMAQAVADVFSKAWSDNATEKRITRRSEPWWNDTCSETLLQYRDDKTPENWSNFRKATRAAKRKFFRVLYSPPRLTTGIRWIRWIPVDFQWIQQDYIIVIKRLQIYLVDPVDFWWIVVNFWWITGGSGGHVVDCGGFLVDLWICDRL